MYTTCIVGVISDDVDSLQGGEPGKRNSDHSGTSTRISGIKKTAIALLVNLFFQLVGTQNRPMSTSQSTFWVILVAGELWILLDYYKRMGIHVNATITGDGRVDDICNAHRASWT